MTRRTPAQYNWATCSFDDRILPAKPRRATKPRAAKIEFIGLHHMTIFGDGSGKALDGCLRTWKEREASAHYGVEEDLVAQFVWDRDSAWALANDSANQRSINIEHANSKLGPSWEISAKTLATSARLVANLHVLYKLGRPVPHKTIRWHQEFYATACPGPFFTSSAVWNAYVANCQKIYDEITGAKPKPKPKPVTVTTVYQNVAGYNRPTQPGVLGFKKHIPSIARAVIGYKPDSFLTNELSNKLIPRMLPLMDASLEGHLQRAPHGYSGHYAYTDPAVKVIASGWMRAKSTSWYLRDSKEGCWIVYEKDGKRALDATFQAEHKIGKAPDAKRVAQALDFDTQIFALAAKYGVPTANVLYMPDTNSEGQVIAALIKRGRVNAAAGTRYEHTTTFNAWGKKTPKRYDYAVVGKGAKIVSIVVDSSKNSDHDRLIVVRNLI